MAATSVCTRKLFGLSLRPRPGQWFGWNQMTRSASFTFNKQFSDFKDPNDPCDPNDPTYKEKYEKPPHIETPITHSMELLSAEPIKGKIFEKLPHRVLLEAGKKYSFCTCGFSKNQPFCDGAHKAPHHVSSRPHHIKYRPIRFTVEETKEYWLCACKQSDNRPFCDGTHKRPEVQEAVRS